MQQHKKDADDEVNYRYVASNLGVGMDIFLFNPYTYITTQAAIFTVQGNAYFSYGFGLGIQL
jgi:hypothetical protein